MFHQVVSPSRDQGLDFIGVSQPTVFPPGLTDELRSVTFTVRDDDLPEQDELFELRLLITNGHGVTGNLDQANVIVTANDDAHGIFSLATVRKC